MRIRLAAIAALASLLALTPLQPALGGEIPPDQTAFPMADIGGTLNLPKGWESTRWSDWDFGGKSPDGSIILMVYMTPWQVIPTDENAQAWAKLITGKLEEQKLEQVAVSRAVAVDGGNKAVIDLTFQFGGKDATGVCHAAIIPGAGKDIHFATISADRASAKAQEALDTILADFALEKKPEDLAALGGVARSERGFEADLPEGWRKYAETEVIQAFDLASKVGYDPEKAERCWIAVRPQAEGSPDLMFFCHQGFYLDLLNDYSWPAIEKQVHGKFFGNSPHPVPEAEKLQLADRLGFLYRPPATNEALFVSVVPYDKGLVLGWMMGSKEHEADLAETMHAVVSGTRFDGPDNGAPLSGAGVWLTYMTKYRKGSPLFWGPIMIVGIAFAVGLYFLTRKPKVVYPV